MKKRLYILYLLTVFCALFFMGYLPQKSISSDDVKKAFLKEDQDKSGMRREMFLCALDKKFDPKELVFLGLYGDTYSDGVFVRAGFLGEMTDIPGDMILSVDGRNFIIPPFAKLTHPDTDSTLPHLNGIFNFIKNKWSLLNKEKSVSIYEKYIHNILFKIDFEDWRQIRENKNTTIRMDKKNSKEAYVNMFVAPDLDFYIPPSNLTSISIEVRKRKQFSEIIMGTTEEAGGLNYLKEDYYMRVSEIRKKYSLIPQ